MTQKKEHIPIIGKNILGILTSGMYQNPLMIYREYIQNSADQIDELTQDEREDNDRKTIKITVDPAKRRVVIRDHATGIPASEFAARLLNVADSRKDPAKNKGFRGIGRLAALSYCRRLVFTASADGETSVSRLEMDCDRLRSILRDADNHTDAGSVITEISTIAQSDDGAESFERFFQVELVDVDDQVGDVLLDADAVGDFIAQIAPVRYSKTTFPQGQAIRDWAEKNGYPLDEYSIQVNGKTILKPYKSEIYDVNGKVVETLGVPVFREIKFKGERLAWCWFIPCTSGKSIVESKNPERKIRLRKCNIQIGFDDFLDKYFPEARSNGYMVGEIHLISNRILPNGDRNGLDVSHEAAAFVRQLQNVEFRQLWQAAREASSLSSAEKQITSYEQQKETLASVLDNPETPSSVKEKAKSTLEKAYEAAKKAKHSIDKSISKPKHGNEFLKKVVESHGDDKTILAPPPPIPSTSKKNDYNPVVHESNEMVFIDRVKLQNEFLAVLSEAGFEIGQCLGWWKKLDERLS